MPLGTDLTAPVTAVISGKMNAAEAREEQKRQHRYNKELMNLSYKYGQSEQQNSALNTKLGYRMAGISPALVAQGNFAPASGPSPLASTPTPNRFPKMDSLGIGIETLLQMKNLKAQTANLEANTKNTEIKNQQEQNANEVSQYLSDVYFSKLADSAHSPEEQKAYEHLASIAKNKGAYGLLMSYIDNLDKRELYDAHYQEYLLKKDLAWFKRNGDNEGIFLNMARMDSKQFEHLDASIKMLIEQAKALSAQKELTDEERNLKLSQIKLTDEQIANLKAVTENVKNSNIVKMVDDGEYGKALIATILMLLGNVSASASKKF